MRCGTAKVDVNDDYGNENGDDVEDEGEQQVLGHQRDRRRGRRKNFGNEQQEDDN